MPESFPSITKITIHEDPPDHITHHTAYTFFLRGWRRLLAPLLSPMIARWNARMWEEDLPLKLRRQKMLPDSPIEKGRLLP